MSRETLIDLLYLFSATTFIVALKGLGSPKRARYGNMVAAFGMLVAIVATFFKYVDGHALHHVGLILLAMLIGVIIAVPTARFVQMTAMPQLVAIFNGVGGGAASLVSITEFVHIKSTNPATYVTLEVLLGVLMQPWNQGACTFFIFAAAMLPFCVATQTAAVLGLVTIGSIGALEGILLHVGGWTLFYSALFPVIIGAGNTFFAERNRINRQLRRANEEIENLAKVAERERIARDLHDVLGHTLSVITLKSELAGKPKLRWKPPG